MNGALHKMAQNNAWANEVLHGACAALSNEQIWAQRPGFFGSIGRTLNHIYEVDLYYVDALEEGGLGRSVYAREDVRELDVLFALQYAVDARLIAVFEGSQDLSRKVETHRPDTTCTERFDHLALHLFQHQIHHRGQVHTMLSHADIDPPQLDDFYLEFGRVDSAKAYWK